MEDVGDCFLIRNGESQGWCLLWLGLERGGGCVLSYSGCMHGRKEVAMLGLLPQRAIGIGAIFLVVVAVIVRRVAFIRGLSV